MTIPDGGGEYAPAIVWRSLPLRLATLAIPLWFTAAVLILSTPWRLKLIVGAMLALSIAAPAEGLLAVAVLVPLGHLIAFATVLDTFRLAEALVLAFLTGWLVRADADRPGPRVPGAVGWLFAAAVLASIVSQIWQLGQTRPYRGELQETFELLFYAYYFVADRVGFDAGAHVLEGVALVVATVTLFRRHPRLASAVPIALAASAALAAASSLLLWYGFAPIAIAERYRQIGFRVSAHVADVNAASS